MSAEIRASRGPLNAAHILGRTALFASLDADSLARLAAVSSQRTYPRGQYLWYQGDPGDRLFVIGSGLVKVVLASSSGDEMLLATLGAFEAIGELAVLDGAPRSASVIAVEPTTVVILERETLFELFRQHPAMLDALLRSLGALIRRLTEQTGDLVFLDLTGRVAKLLIRLTEQTDAPERGPVLRLRLSQSEVAAMVGATRPAVNRVLQSLAARELIRTDGRVVVIRNLDELRRRAQL